MREITSVEQINYMVPLKTIITGLTPEQKAIVIENIEIGKRASTFEILQRVQELIEDHKIIFDCKESLFFKRTGKQIWVKHD